MPTKVSKKTMEIMLAAISLFHSYRSFGEVAIIFADATEAGPLDVGVTDGGGGLSVEVERLSGSKAAS